MVISSELPVEQGGQVELDGVHVGLHEAVASADPEVHASHVELLAAHSDA